MDRKIKNIHFLGIGGISQSALALILKSKGYFVSGSDRVESEITKKLEKMGIPVCINAVSGYLYSSHLVVASAAIKNDDEEFLLAKNLGVKIISRAKMLGIIAKKYKNVISVAGSHGKTTTTGMISTIFLDAGKKPTIHIGGNMDKIKGNVYVGDEEFFITEACEYMDSFLKLKSDVSVVLNVQPDHLDYFKTFDNVKKSFKKYAENTKKRGVVVYNRDDENACLNYKQNTISYSLNGFGVISAKDIKEYEKGKYQFSCYLLGNKLFTLKLNVYGKHNIENALAAICVGLYYGINVKIIKQALESFSGIKRRFEDYGYVNGVKVIHDYAHHPTEIKAIINTARNLTKNDVYVVFQPHTYSRTKLLYKEFLDCFKGAKETCIYKVYSAREKESEGINEKELARGLSLNGEKAFSFDNYKEMKEHILSKAKENDILLVLGAGDIESFASFIRTN